MRDDPTWTELHSCYILLPPTARAELLEHARDLTVTALKERNRGGLEARQRKKSS